MKPIHTAIALLAAPLAALAVALAAGPAAAAPVARPADLTLDLRVIGIGTLVSTYNPYGYSYNFGSREISLEASAQVTVDVAAGTLGLTAGTLSQTEPAEWFVLGSTAVDTVSVVGFSHGDAVFSVGGAAGGDAACPVGSGACVPQAGFGGEMTLTGTYNINIVPNIVVIPIALAGFGTGGSTQAPFTFDYAPWTVGTATIRFSTQSGDTSTLTTRGSITGSGFRLVSPTYVQALGNILPYVSTLRVEFSDGLGVPGFVSGQVPEPAAWLLAAAAGALAYALTGRS